MSAAALNKAKTQIVTPPVQTESKSTADTTFTYDLTNNQAKMSAAALNKAKTQTVTTASTTTPTATTSIATNNNDKSSTSTTTATTTDETESLNKCVAFMAKISIPRYLFFN